MTIGFYIIIWQMSTFEEFSQNLNPQKPTFFQKIRNIWLKYEEKFILLVGILMIAAIAFEAGFLYGEKNKKEPVLVQKIADEAGLACPQYETDTNKKDNKGDTKQDDSAKTENKVDAENKNCAYVASKNSNKYHLPTCQFAQKIKPENKVCFSSAEEAQGRGYQGAKCCIK
jgi:hypothetical protein